MTHTAEYAVKGMHCNACVQKITEALESVEGVTSADVSLDDERARVEAAAEPDRDALRSAVTKKGDYSIDPVDESADGDADQHKALQELEGDDSSDESLYPLILIVAYLAGAVLLISLATADWALMPMMRRFMAGFFLAFSFFKLLDLPGFVSAYRGYDLLAKRSRAYAYAYPFIELALGVLYLTSTAMIATNAVTLVLMSVGAVGVLKALLDKKQIRCACLGTALNLPMTTVTLVEDLAMAAMAGAMLLMLLI